MKLLILVLLVAGSSALSQTPSITGQQWTKGNAAKWFNDKKWMTGLRLQPHASIDKQEFAKQYHANKARWDLAFQYLRKTRLDTLKPGRYPLDGDDVYVLVTEGPTKDISKALFEAHTNYADIHCIISGREKMGVAPFAGATLVKAYDPAKDIAFYTAAGTYYTVSPGTFFIFFAQKDAHEPGLKAAGFDSDKRIVIKVKTTHL